MEQILALLSSGKLVQAKHRLKGLKASFEGLGNHQISAQHKATMVDLIQGVINGLP